MVLRHDTVCAHGHPWADLWSSMSMYYKAQRIYISSVFAYMHFVLVKTTSRYGRWEEPCLTDMLLFSFMPMKSENSVATVPETDWHNRDIQSPQPSGSDGTRALDVDRQA